MQTNSPLTIMEGSESDVPLLIDGYDKDIVYPFDKSVPL